ncbi:MAG TPA: cytochrome c [Candidatus Dormibacteraeota bacterium]
MPAGVVRKLTLGLGIGVFGCLVAVGTIGATADSPSPSASASPGAAAGAGLPGDPAKGQTAYSAAGCTSCHGASLEGGIGPRLNPLQKISGTPDFKKADEPQVAQYLINTITNGKAPSDGFGQMPVKGGSNTLSDQDIKDIASYIIQANLSGKTPLGPAELARSNVFWVTVGIGAMVLLTYLLAQYNMRWIARRAAARRGRLG